MKVGDIFDLPENVIPQPGQRGNIRGQDGKALVGRYQVVEVDGKIMGRVIVTYGNKRKAPTGGPQSVGGANLQ